MEAVPKIRASHQMYMRKRKRENSCGNVVILSLLVFFVGLVALAGLLVGVFVWLDSTEKDDSLTAKPPVTRAPPLATTSTTRRIITEGPITTAPEEFCLPHRTSASCSSCVQKYRTYDGTCNNENNPLWGASEIPFKRLLGPIYEDGYNTPVGWNQDNRYHGYAKPSARLVSQEIMTTPRIVQSVKYTDLVMVWGQYFDHDTDHTPKTDSLCTETCKQKSPYCFPIFAPENDPRLADGGCIALTRSTRVCDLKPREQLNSITSYVDASLVYGSTRDRALELRDMTQDSGHLTVGIVSVEANGKASKPLLPFANDFPQACNLPMTDNSGIPCFFAGDVRANEHIGLIALHTLWVREHNRIADELKKINPQWSGETLYQEARKIVGALHQIITYNHWLPKIVGSKGIELLGSYHGYDHRVDASTVNSFATAAFRFGHAQISPTVVRLGSDFQEAPKGNLPLHKAAFCPFRIVNEDSIDPVLRGMFGTPLKTLDPENIMSDEVTENLFKLARDVAHDLAALNIQRGRDHGLPGYNQWRKICGLSVANTFDDLSGEILDASLRRKLEMLYGHPDNVDLFVAGLIEDPWHDSLLGPTFTCLLVDQFRRWRNGDRFWYQNPGVFTPAQLIQLNSHSLGRVICDSGDHIEEVQSDVFKRATYPDGYKSCDEIPGMDLAHAWKDFGNDNGCIV